MTVEVIAEVCLSAYYDGRVLTNDKKLEKKDFQQLVYAALGDIGRIEWYQEAQRGNQDFYWGRAIITGTFVVTKLNKKLIIDMTERHIMTLPRASGIIRMYPDSCDGDTWEDDLQKVAPGAESFYLSPKQLDDLGMKGYVLKGEMPEVYGVKEGDQINVDYIPNDLKLDVPEGLASVVIKDIITTLTPSQGRSVDTTEDGNPNINTYKARLDDPKGV